MALESILERTTTDDRKEALRKIPRIYQPRDDAIPGSRRPASHSIQFHPTGADTCSPLHDGQRPRRSPRLQLLHSKQIEAQHPVARESPRRIFATEPSEATQRNAGGLKDSSKVKAHMVNGRQCKGVTRSGERCKNRTSSELCSAHCESATWGIPRY